MLSLLAVAAATGQRTTAPALGDPYYADPLFDAAHDAEFVWHEEEQTWWLIYLQVRQNRRTLGCIRWDVRYMS